MRIYEAQPKTPFHRLLERPEIPEPTKQTLREQHTQLNPIELKKRLEHKLRKFFPALGKLILESTKA